MNILFDINHPADVHQFKFPIKKLQKNHNVLVVARGKDCVFDILKKEKIEYVERKGYSGLFMKIFGIFLIDIKLLKISFNFRPDILVGSSGDVYVAHVGRLLRKPSIVFDDTEHSKFQNMLCFPFATKVYTPDSYKLDLGKKQERYEGFKELGYLSKKYFKPDISVKKELGNYVFLRLVSWDAIHDIGKEGLGNVSNLIVELEKHGRVYVSSEGNNPELAKYKLPSKYVNKIHDVLFYSNIVVSEGGTMAVESAVLGTPTIYTNQLHMGYSDLLVSKGRMKQIIEVEEIIENIPKMVGKRKKPMELKFDINEFIVEKILENG